MGCDQVRINPFGGKTTLLLLQAGDNKLDIHSHRSALILMKDYRAEEKFLIGLLFIDPDSQEIHKTMHTTSSPRRNLKEDVFCPGSTELKKENELLR